MRKNVLPGFTPPPIPGYVHWSNHSLTPDLKNAIDAKRICVEKLNVPPEAVLVVPFEPGGGIRLTTYVREEFATEVEVFLSETEALLHFLNYINGREEGR